MIRFTDIHRINERTLEAVVPAQGDAASIEALLALDARARRHARTLVEGSAR